MSWAPRRLVAAYAVLTALFNLAVLLPGNPYEASSAGDLVAGLAIQALIVWGLWRGSVVAWVLAMSFAALWVLTVPLMEPPAEVGVILMLVFSGLQVAILATREVRAFVDRGARDGRPVHYRYGRSS